MLSSLRSSVRSISGRNFSSDASHKSVAQQLLKAIGSQKEIDQYMDLYSNASQFAMIKVGGDCIAHQLDELSPALSFLHHVGLRPIVVHGAGPQMNKLLEEQKVISDTVNIDISLPLILSNARSNRSTKMACV